MILNMSSEITFDKIQEFRDEVFEKTEAHFFSSIKNYEEKFDNIINGLVGNNKFLTEFSFIEKDFVRKINIFECTGYTDEEFNILTLNNDKSVKPHITHPDDIIHKLRYDNITYMIISNNYKFKALSDYYKLSFRLKNKQGKIIKVERSVFIFRVLEDGTPISQLDIWEVSENSSPYVTASYYIPDFNNIMCKFYELNTQLLNFTFTDKEKQILSLKDKQLSNKEIVNILNIKSIRTIEKHISNMIKKVNTYYETNKIKKQIYSIHEVLNFTKTFGLFPFY